MHVALFIRSLAGAGGERVVVNLATAMAERGIRVDVVLARAKGAFLSALPAAVRVVDLEAGKPLRAVAPLVARPADLRALLPVLAMRKPPWVLASIPALTRYLRNERPTALYSALDYGNIAAICAAALSGTGTPLVISQHGHFTSQVRYARKDRVRRLPPLARRFYPRADGIVAVSNGVADDLSRATGVARDRITTIYNPIVTADFFDRAGERLDHDWLRPGQPPVILGVASLKPHKGFPTLVRAFARVRSVRPARLIILGEGPDGESLRALARDLGVDADVHLAGFVGNPLPYMARAGVFVVASIYEGLSNVLVEAMACGCPVVSTDCPTGPAEILEGGRHGPLVPVGDDAAMARAILATLDRPPDRDRLRERASFFTADRATEQVIALVESICVESICRARAGPARAA